MNDAVIRFFNSVAATWDCTNRVNEAAVEKILNIAGVAADKTVLDVGCGTGVLIPYYLSKRVKSVTAIDISEEMIRIAKEKFKDSKITFVCGDIKDFACAAKFDCVIVHNAFPHLMNREETVPKLKALTAQGGTLTIAHSISRRDVLNCHKKIPEISAVLPETGAVAQMLKPELSGIVEISDTEMYLVSGTKKEAEENANE